MLLGFVIIVPRGHLPATHHSWSCVTDGDRIFNQRRSRLLHPSFNVRLAVVAAPVYLMKTRNNLGEESSLGWVEGDEGEAELIVLVYDHF